MAGKMWLSDRLMFEPTRPDETIQCWPLHPRHEAISIVDLGPLSREESLHGGRYVDFRGRSVVWLSTWPEADSGQPSGARDIIKALSKRDTVACLILRHNKLGDEGGAELFKYLCSEEGQRHKVAGILLNENRLGNVALESIGKYLRDNKWLRELYLASVRSNLPAHNSTPETPL